MIYLVDSAQSYICEMPGEFDTSLPLILKIEYAKNGGNGGNLALRLDYAIVTPGNVIGTPAGTPSGTVGATTGILVTPVPTLSNTVGVYEFSININSYVSSTDSLWLQVSRLGSSSALDTYDASIYLYRWTLKYKSWSVGGY